MRGNTVAERIELPNAKRQPGSNRCPRPCRTTTKEESRVLETHSPSASHPLSRRSQRPLWFTLRKSWTSLNHTPAKGEKNWWRSREVLPRGLEPLFSELKARHPTPFRRRQLSGWFLLPELVFGTRNAGGVHNRHPNGLSRNRT